MNTRVSLFCLFVVLSLSGCGSETTDCTRVDGARCEDGVVYWVDNCGNLLEEKETCACGCAVDGVGCKEPCDCVPSCQGKECGPDGCGGSCPPGCDAPATCDQSMGRCVVCTMDEQCDDDNPCTDDTCTASGCSNTPVADDTGCDDGQWCTVSDVCSGGSCAGTPRDCDDGDWCTLDSCNEDNDTCRHETRPDPGEEGPVGSPTCGNGLDDDCDGLTDDADPDCCACSSDTDCDDGNLCTRDQCDGCTCSNQPLEDGTGCDDGLFCNGQDTCSGGVCSHAGNPCGPGYTCDEAGGVCHPPAWEDLLSRRVGFGREAGGGAGGELCRVTSLADSGAGSLRACAETEGPRWVRFEVSGDITLASNIAVASRITIDGRGQHITIRDHGLRISGVSDVIVHNIAFDDGGDGDAVQIINEASDIWLDHLTLSSYGDGLVDITRAATDITVSWCRFENHDKVMLISASVDHTDDVNIRVTLHHNYFRETVQRHPRLRYGKVHAFNNYLYHWTGYGMASSMDGQLLSEDNIFEAGSDIDAVITRAGEDPRDGAVESRRDWQLNGAMVDENDTESVFEARDYYDYTLEDANDDLRDTVRSQAGWRDIPFPG